MNPVITFFLGVCVGAIAGLIITCLLVMAQESQQERRRQAERAKLPVKKTKFTRVCDECVAAEAQLFCTTHAAYVCAECLSFHPDIPGHCRYMSVVAAQEWAKSLGAQA